MQRRNESDSPKPHLCCDWRRGQSLHSNMQTSRQDEPTEEKEKRMR